VAWKPGDTVTIDDPQWDRRRGGRKPPRPTPASNVDPAALVALSLEAGPLTDLVGWPPVGALLETLREAATGDGGLTRRDTDRIRRWAHRWASLKPRLRAFYRSMLITLDYFEDLGREARGDQVAVSRALWRIFEGYEIEGWAMGALQRLWDDHEGSLPMYSLAPRGNCGTSGPPRMRRRNRR